MAFLEQTFFNIAYPLRLLYWFVFRPRTQSVKCLIEYDGKLLLVRSRYWRRYWTLPGGRIRIQTPFEESPVDAAKRELREVVGLTADPLVYLGIYDTGRHFLKDSVFCFYGKVDTAALSPHGVEILEARWFLKNALPYPQSPTIGNVLRLYTYFKSRSETAVRR